MQGEMSATFIISPTLLRAKVGILWFELIFFHKPFLLLGFRFLSWGLKHHDWGQKIEVMVSILSLFFTSFHHCPQCKQDKIRIELLEVIVDLRWQSTLEIGRVTKLFATFLIHLTTHDSQSLEKTRSSNALLGGSIFSAQRR